MITRVSAVYASRLMPAVELLAKTGDKVGAAPVAELRVDLDDVSRAMTEQLVPHMEAAERVFYPELERMMQNRHSMTPMRREHQEIRRLVADLDRQRAFVSGERLAPSLAVSLRRTLFQLYAFLKIHLAEEQLYDDIVENGLSEEAESALAAAWERCVIRDPE